MKFPLKFAQAGLITSIIYFTSKLILNCSASSGESKENENSDNGAQSEDSKGRRMSDPNPPSSSSGSHKILRLNLTDQDEIMKIPSRQPFDLVEEGSERKVYPERIIPGESQCIYKKFRYFYKQAAKLQIIPAELFLTAVVSHNATDVYFYNSGELCIAIEDELIIDTHHYDCNRAGVCVCGLYYGYVDPNVPQPEPRRNIRSYVSTNGLDRKLVVEYQLCVSGYMGHCTLPGSTAVEKLDCSSTTECVIDESYGPILVNKVTNEQYGFCLPKKPKPPPGENYSLDDYKRMIDNS